MKKFLHGANVTIVAEEAILWITPKNYNINIEPNFPRQDRIFGATLVRNLSHHYLFVGLKFVVFLLREM